MRKSREHKGIALFVGLTYLNQPFMASTGLFPLSCLLPVWQTLVGTQRPTAADQDRNEMENPDGTPFHHHQPTTVPRRERRANENQGTFSLPFQLFYVRQDTTVEVYWGRLLTVQAWECFFFGKGAFYT